MKLRTKLTGGFAVILFLMIILGLTGIYATVYIEKHLANTIEQDVKPAVILGVMARRAGLVRANSLLHMVSDSVEDMNRYESEMAEWEGKINTDFDILDNMFADKITLDRLAEFRTAWETYLRIWNEQVLTMSRLNRNEEVFALIRKKGVVGIAAQEAMYKLEEVQDLIGASAVKRLEAADQLLLIYRNILLGITFLTFVLGMVFTIKLSLQITSAVNSVSKAAKLAAAGDLNQKVAVKTGDEIESMANSFNTMTENMKKMVKELQLEIIAHQQTEDTLRQSRLWLSTTLRSIGDAVISTDTGGVVTLMNPVAEELTGWEEAEAVGRPMKDVFNIFNEQTGKRAENPVDKVLREGIVVGLANHTELIARDGTKRPIVDSGAPIRGEEGNIIGTVMVFHDNTELKRIEEQLVRKENLVTLGQLAGGVGHELRNPLGVMSNAVYYLKAILPEADETVKEYLEIISGELHKSESIVSDILDLSRTRPAERKETDLSELADTIMKKQLSRNVKVNTEIPRDLPPVFIDPAQIDQVLDNLVTNACQAMPDGGKLTISARVENKKISLSISDTGCGISNENIKKLFEPLFTTKARGIGLGLTLSKNLVEINGGSLEVKSKEGVGSTFTVILPAEEVVS
ncbi:MAG: MCP four helix bundle domain-containing protein [Spirochaetaceae bacterium]|nr:MCP four helix bundle domain-containing protein [Spirochaetaceae bacterium]